ncbi:hypothetical protein COT69_02810 [candidate division WWE3 bacterium CG09_land_8_20_14_0_10_39_24]|uniref:Type 4 fimbrial biogenesis protein PilX N-terminal domain-containing protein n=2 Tax=Katanobacteria TaxID=422282 RepID=A0A2G9XCD2_UNCKA|nr:MAG: hypothetical protein BK003_02665 [bacterium CG09_39_24]PIP04640.1 MAG: hypothetical protein COX53_01355 [candidate division WWE3 bacterium CG23_combo_of_CG06-09_8_20_14_all_40_14]PIS12657.1 MAG: hypothetical protein COT69_02810 [candidate division WWE3 bacterium CG09_land_8_20_14_0_10_39_24]PJE51513.1 MAG: hypothetical protein COV27_01900 [candidate division WWE3 bacterium CG10_big_fil_rev_8_21_14_0_10_39_14]
MNKLFSCILNNRNKGQATLVVVVLVMVVSLAVGVAASNRAISNIRMAAYTAQGDQALHCAESGAEDGLNKINELEKSSFGTYNAVLKDSDNVDICSYEYTISEFSGEVLTYPLVKQDDSQEVNLDGYNGSLSIYFGSDDSAALEITFIKGSSPPYSVEKYAYNCEELYDNNFEDGSSNGGEDLPCGTESFNISGYKIARIRPLYADTKVVVKFGSVSQSQGYLIESIGSAGTAQRKVQVIRTNAQLPAIFDYSIFSASETEPLSK